jgi:peptidyl-prolyl cis-trans isomerase D
MFMLQNIRQNIQGTTAKIVVGLIVITFGLFGIESILVNGGGNDIADVNGESISPQELQQALDTQKRRMIAMMGDNIDPTMLDDERLRPQALQALVNRKLQLQSAESLKLAISENAIGSVVGSMEEFQVDGVFSPDLYKSVLSNAGYTPAYFKQSLSDDMLLTQQRSGLAGSEFVTASELELNSRVISEQRDLRYFTIPKEKFSSVSPVSEAQIEAYYNDHQEAFRTPETVDIDYLELSLDDFRTPVEESTLREAYELAKQGFQFQTQNRVSHILFQSGDDNDVTQRLASAQEKLAAGVAFADVAKEFSDDVGSAPKGGDLGYTSGTTFPEAMEAAIAKLEPGVVSAPIKTDAGTHLVLVTERKKGEEASFEQMRDQLTQSIQADEARVVLLRTVESLKDLAFNAEDLAFPAKELSLTVKQANGITRTVNKGLFSNNALIESAFSEDVLSSGNNSEVIELPDDRYVVMHVRKHNTPEVMPLETVRSEVVSALVEEAARAAVASEARRALEQLRTGLAMDDFARTQGYDLRVELSVDRRSTTVPPDVLRRVFELPPPAANMFPSDYIVAPNGDAVVIELQRVSPGEYKSLAVAEQAQLQQLLRGEFGGLINEEFQRGLQERAEITIR